MKAEHNDWQQETRHGKVKIIRARRDQGAESNHTKKHGESTREQSQTTQKSMENHSPNSSSISQKLITSVMLQEKHAGVLDAANKCI
jgi:hypothetical protein